MSSIPCPCEVCAAMAFILEQRGTIHILGDMPARGGNPPIGGVVLLLLRDGRSANAPTFLEAVAKLRKEAA